MGFKESCPSPHLPQKKHRGRLFFREEGKTWAHHSDIHMQICQWCQEQRSKVAFQGFSLWLLSTPQIQKQRADGQQLSFPDQVWSSHRTLATEAQDCAPHWLSLAPCRLAFAREGTGNSSRTAFGFDFQSVFYTQRFPKALLLKLVSWCCAIGETMARCLCFAAKLSQKQC